MIAEAMSKVGRKGVVTLEEGRSAENTLYVVEGMQFDRGYISPYFVTDSEKMSVEYDNCKVKHSVNSLQMASFHFVTPSNEHYLCVSGHSYFLLIKK